MPEFRFDFNINVTASIEADDEAAARAAIEKAVSDALWYPNKLVEEPMIEIEKIEFVKIAASEEE